MINKKPRKLVISLIFFYLFWQIPHLSLAKSSKKSTTSTTSQNGDLSTHISLSEIFPNPKGTDTDKEWIELFNQEKHQVNLGNWSLNISNPTKNTKPKTIKFNDKTIIKANSYLVIDSSSYKFSILNNNCKIELKDFVGKSIDSTEYENSEENLSLAHINIAGKNKNITTWTTPTKGTANPIYYEILGTIKEKHISSDKTIQSYLKITANENKNVNIYLSSESNLELINNTLKPNDQILFLVKKDQEKKYLFLDFKIEKQAPLKNTNKQNKENWLYYSTIPLLIGLVWLLYKTFGFHRIINNLDNIRPR